MSECNKGIILYAEMKRPLFAPFVRRTRLRGSAVLGRITTLAGDPRVMQLALKFYF